MLTAHLSDGKTLNLAAGVFQPSSLHELRKTASFYCPICQKPMDLKLGSIKAFHFAHKRNADCPYTGEPESKLHLEGKTQLYEWLNGQTEVLLEPYLKELNQRPDLLAAGAAAIEYQCSLLDQQLLDKRTAAYRDHGYEPIWILGGNRIARLSSSLFRFSTFHWQCTRIGANHFRPYLLSYSPGSKTFLRLSHLIPFSKTSVFARQEYLHLDRISFKSLLSPQAQGSFPFKNWAAKIKKHRMSPHFRLSAEAAYLKNVLYNEKSIPFSCIPSYAFLPLSSGCCFESSVYVWQTRLLLWIDRQPLSCFFHAEEAVRHVAMLVNRRQLFIRRLPHWTASESISLPVSAYLDALSQLGCLQKEEEKYKKTGKLYWRGEPDALIEEDQRLLSRFISDCDLAPHIN